MHLPAPHPPPHAVFQKGRRAFNTRIAPRLRWSSSTFMSVLVLFYYRVYGGRWGWREALLTGAIAQVYCLCTWLALRRWYGPKGWWNLQDSIMVLDTFAASILMIYTGGAETPFFPFLWFIVANQVGATFAKALIFPHLTVLSYLGVLLLNPFAAHPVDWGRAGLNLVFLYVGGLFLAMPTLLVEALRNRNRENIGAITRLNDFLKAQAESIKAAQVQAEQANRAKSTFIANMSHELRTPLNAILGFTQLLSRKQDRPPEEQKNLGRILRAGEHLLELIDDVLSLSKIEAGYLELRSKAFDLRQLLRDVEDLLRPRADAKGLLLRVEVTGAIPSGVRGDAGKLRQILLNLVGNAVKFTEAGEVLLQVNYQEAAAAFAIQDTGPGISVDEQKELFRPFSQASAGLKAFEGTGLGLHICLALVQQLGGQLSLESEPGRGATFRFSLPLPASLELVEGRGQQALTLVPGQSLPALLVVDDQKENRELLQDFFSGLGFQVHTAQDGVEAVESWDRHRPGVVLMDIRMPRMTGQEAGREIRRREAASGGRTILIVLTASVFEEDRQDLEAFDRFVGKPFHTDYLLTVVAELAGLRLQAEGPAAELLPAESLPEAASLEPGWRADFLRALRSCDIDEAGALLGELEESNLKTALRARLADYRFDEIRRLLG